MIRIRRPKLDNGAIFRLVRDQLYPYTRKVFPDRKLSRRLVMDRVRKGTTYVAAASIRHPAIGFITFYPDGDLLWIDMLAVSPGHRRKGLGTRLMRKAESTGMSQSCSRAMLYVNDSNRKAQRFYRKLGFSPVRHEPDIQSFLYGKSLQD